MSDQEFNDRVEEFVKRHQQVVNDHYAEHYNKLVPPVITYKLNKKFAKVVRDNSSVICFVANSDFSTKGLGIVKKGDIFKPAGFNAPAKHARGNIYAQDFGMSGMSEYGPKYLR